MIRRKINGNICLIGILLIIKGCGSDVGHIAVGSLFTVAKIKGRTEKLGSAGTLEDPIPVCSFGFAHGRKIAAGKLIFKKLDRIHRKIHINLKSGDLPPVYERLHRIMKFVGLRIVKKQGGRRVDRLMKDLLKKRKIRDFRICVQDLLYFLFDKGSCFGGSILLPADRVGDHHIIEPAVKKDPYRKHRNGDGNYQDDGKL